MNKDYYKILEVEKTATQAEIKKAFHKKAHQCHPDKTGGDEAKFKEINEAYQILGNEQKRTQYDRFGDVGGNGGFQGGRGNYENWNSGGFNVDFEDLSDIFNGFGDIFGARQDGGRTRRGDDIRVMINIDFMEAVFGVEKEIKLNKFVVCEHCRGNGAEPGSKIETCSTCRGTGAVTSVQRTFLGNIQTKTICPDCHGEGKKITQKCSQCFASGRIKKITEIKVAIPAGINEGEVIKLSGHGEVGPKGSLAGDLYLDVRINKHDFFERHNYDIKAKIDLGFIQLADGDKIEVQTVDGLIKLKIPSGTKSGTIFRLKERGVPRLRGRGRGDHLLEVNVKIPKGLSRKQKKGLEELEIE